MKLCGIICEYNPLHGGHIRHIEYTRMNSECDTVVCVMSGNFVQRGEAACLEKHVRAIHAVRAGADIVVELPAVFSVGAADDFAYGAMKYLLALNCDCISFGSECGDLAVLSETARRMAAVEGGVKSILKSGVSYPAAFARALGGYPSETPNDLLAAKYIFCGNKMNYQGRYITLKRDGGYNSLSTSCKSSDCSARAVRDAVNSGRTDEIRHAVPEYTASDLINYLPVERFESFVNMFISVVGKEYLQKVAGVSEGLENRIINAAGAPDYATFINGVKTKRYTMLRIKRVLCSAALGVTKDVLESARLMRPYINILAINSKRKDILTYLSCCTVTKDVKAADNAQIQVRTVDKRAETLYNSLSGRIAENKYLTEV